MSKKNPLYIMTVTSYGEGIYHAEFLHKYTRNRYELTTASRNRLDFLVEKYYPNITNVYLNRLGIELEYQF